MKDEILNDLLYYNNLKIFQSKDCFSFSLDSILLPNFITVNKNVKNILDIGTGNAPMPLVLSTRTKAHIDGIEIQDKIYNLATHSIKINNLEGQINIIKGDIKEYSKYLETDTYDIIISNPPYFKYNQKSNINDSDYLTIARHEKYLNLEELLKISKKLLKNNGVFGIIHRTERLLDIILLMRKNNIEPKKIQFIYPKELSDSNLVLIEGRKNGKPGLKILNPLVIHNEDGSYKKNIIKIFGGKNDTKKL